MLSANAGDTLEPISAATTFLDLARAEFLAAPNQSTFSWAEVRPGTQGPALARLDSVTNADFDAAARTLAVRLRERCDPGDRVVILCEPGLGYVTAFFACLYAGVVAVPVYPPTGAQLSRAVARLDGILADCTPSVALTTQALAGVAAMLPGALGGVERLPLVLVDDPVNGSTDGPTDDESGGGWRRPPVIGSDVAFLQYTSGSTAQPKGVKVTHANLVHQTLLVARSFAGPLDQPCRALTWLPPYHDMGLIGTLLAPVYGPRSVTGLDPMAFLKNPLRWLQLIGQLGIEVIGAPNFAYDLCVSRYPAPGSDLDLDLSSLQVAFCGAEPVRAGTLEQFARTFGPHGFSRTAFLPCYGLAEATLCATSARLGHGARAVTVRRGPDGTVERTASPVTDVTPAGDDGAELLVSSGVPLDGHRVAIVDPATGQEVPDGQVGEIWVQGPSVAAGYWGNEIATAETFGAQVVGLDGPWLRTRDLGCVVEGELLVVGRATDVLIVAGRNHHPHDVEDTVAGLHPAIRRGCAALVGVGVDAALPVLVQEVTGALTDDTGPQLLATIQGAVFDRHGLALHDVVLTRTGVVPKTSSGKVQRSACRDLYVSGQLTDATRWSMRPVEAALAGRP